MTIVTKKQEIPQETGHLVMFISRLLKIWYKTDTTNKGVLDGEYNYSHLSDGQNIYFTLFKFIIHTNLDIQDTACLHRTYMLQHPTSRETANLN
jgi:hypothetical protein